MGCAHGIAVCNGSVAIDVALAALRIGPGDEVILRASLLYHVPRPSCVPAPWKLWSIASPIHGTSIPC
jgi:hypothetical protein